MFDLLPTTEPTATLFKVTLLLMIALAGHRLLRNASAAARHLWASLAIVALVAIPLLSLTLPSWSVALPAPEKAPAALTGMANEAASLDHPREATATAAPMRIDYKAGQVESSSISWEPNQFVGSLTPVETTTAPAATPVDTSMSLVSKAAILWASIASLLLLSLAVGTTRVMSWVARSEAVTSDRHLALLSQISEAIGCREPRLRLSAHSRVPLLWGYFRPTLLLPTAAREWTNERLRVVLTHELAHLERCDWLTLLFGRIAVSLYWFHPLAWYLESQARRDCEEACDDRVLSMGTRASDYASHLLELAQGLRQEAPRPAVALVRPSQVEQRLRAILHPTQPRRSPTRRFALLATLVLLLVVVPLASVRLEAWDPGTDRTAALIGGTTNAYDFQFEGTDLETDFQFAGDGSGFVHTIGEVIHGQLAQVMHSPGDSYSSKAERRWANESPENGQEWFKMAYDYHNEERWEEASEAFMEAAAAGYRPGTSAYNAACGLARMGQHADAMNWLERSISDGFDSFDHFFEDSDLDSLRGSRDFSALLDRYRDEAGSWHRPAMDRLEQAEGAYAKLIESNSQNGDLWHDVGSDLLSLGQYDRAIECLRRSVELDPHRSSATRYNLACAYSRAGQTEAALDALDRAVEWGFDSEERFRNDRDIDNIRGTARFDEIVAKARMLDLDKYRKDGWWNHRESRIDPRMWQPAVDDYRAYVDRYPESPRGWFNLAYSLHYAGQFEEAIRAAQRALDLDYKPSLQMYNIACAYSRLGNVEQAVAWLERAGEAGMSISHSMDDDEDFDNIRSDQRFQDLEEKYWVLDKRRHLEEKKQHLEEMLHELGSKLNSFKGNEAERMALEAHLEAAEHKHKAAMAARAEAQRQRQEALYQEREIKKQALEANTQQIEAKQKAQAEELARLEAQLLRKQAELETRRAELEAERAALLDD